jgi:hypothetical protein
VAAWRALVAKETIQIISLAAITKTRFSAGVTRLGCTQR